MTQLHDACESGDFKKVTALLSNEECDINTLNTDGESPLHIACKYGHLEIVKVLLKDQKCNLNTQNMNGNTPLHLACYKKLLHIIRVLLERRCKTNIPNKKGLLAQCIHLNEDGDSLLHIACRWGDVDIVRYLITDERCDFNIKNIYWNTPLHIACFLKSIKIIRLLLERKCSTIIPNMKGETAQNIPLNDDGDCLLHIACQWDDVDIVRYLITDEKCFPNVQSSTSKNTPLHIAAKYGQDDTIVKLLSYRECDPNAQNKEGDTPLHLAASWNKTAVVSKLLSYRECNPNTQNKDGDIPLHLAVSSNKTAIISKLLAHHKIDVNAQNKKGDTPLHLACHKRSLDVVKLLLEKQCSINIPNKKGETAQDVPLNEDGDCLLHIACKWGDVDIVKYLITDEKYSPNIQSSTSENTPLHIAAKYGQKDAIVQLLSCKECNPNVQNIEGDAPLHVACYMKSLDIIKLLLERKCSTNIPNKKGETAQNIPLNVVRDCLLHIACQWGDVGIVRYLISHERCNPNVQSSTSENTPLHNAAKYGQDYTIVQLLSYKECDPNVQNKEGDTPLHITVKQNRASAISHLLTSKRCNPNILNNDGVTPLHIAIRHEQKDTITKLLSCKKCDLNVQDKEGDTPLHIVVRENRIYAISQLLSNKHCNPNILNNDGATPLQIAIRYERKDKVVQLLSCSKCDPTLCDPHGNTPLHLACISGETQPEMVEVAKQLLTSVDPSCVNNAGQTPIELTTNYQLIQAITHMVQCKTKQSVQTYINMFIVGNPETGKSTLVKAICKEATGILWKIVPKQMRRVKNVPLHTAGIIPTTFRSKTFGNTVLYDLAGQVEYYTSHAAVIQSTVISTPPAFIVVINLSESEEKISETLRYWWSFIDNHAARSSAPPQVILVGSHADAVKSTGRNVQEKMTLISALLKKLPASFHFGGEVALDCRDPASREIKHFCFLVNQSCTILRKTANVDLRCHVLYAFLLERFKGKVACTVSDVATSVQENRELLPQDSDRLIPLLSTLSDKGLLLLVKGGESNGDWWIILQKPALLGEINGTIFAPKDFRQHKDLSKSTGVVPFFKLKEEFPNYNPNMVTEFLIHLEFCFKIEDHQTLALLKDEATNVEDTSPDVSQVYYFFPALVSVENPSHMWEQNDMCCKCGWFYQCIRPDQFLTTQFLHVLILRLAFIFALRLDIGDCRKDSLFLRRKCSVWKHGIGWLNWMPIETVVEVGLQCQSVIVMMRCPEGKEAECVQLRSEVIQKVLEVKDEHCKAVKMSEAFIHPTDINYPFTHDNTDNVKCYSLTGIARMIARRAGNVLDRNGLNPVPVQDLLLFDPYSTDTSSELLRELFSEKHSMEETVRSQVLETLNSESEKYTCVHYAYHVPYQIFFCTVYSYIPASCNPGYGIRSKQ